jgi:hypothetical protein
MNKKEWVEKLKPYWKKYEKIEEDFHSRVNRLEERMRKECGEPNLEFACAKMMGGLELYFGIGFLRDFNERKPNLIDASELE